LECSVSFRCFELHSDKKFATDSSIDSSTEEQNVKKLYIVVIVVGASTQNENENENENERFEY
jgi:hypothetical protein